MPSSDSSREALLEQLAEEFVERHRRGERPAPSEYAEQHPDLAEEIRDLFPALVRIEHLKPVAGDLTGAFVPETSPTAGHIPERLGEYRILRQVGYGGMGVVYEAEQETLGRHVALKVLPRQALLKTTYLERFRREAKAAGKLHHTNIVPVFGVGECDGTYYYAMQFIRGEGLDKVLRDLRRLRSAPADPTAAAASEGSMAHSLLTGRFVVAAEEPSASPAPSGLTAADGSHCSSTLSAGGPEADYYRGIARIAVQVADALAYAHRQGILHRDIKPSNLLLDQQGTVWITDFGLAKAEGADDLTQTGDIVGTIRFMAPERFDGRSLPQSDVYALGVTLYELLTLRPAFDDANKARLVESVLHKPPLSPRKLEPNVPRDLETIVLKCLAKDPAERYGTAEMLAEDLRRFLADRPIKARRSSWQERTWRWCRRNPAVASLLALVAVLLVAVAVISTSAAVWLKSALTDSENEKTRAVAAERDQKLQLYQGHVTEAKYRRFSRRQGQRFASLDAIRQALRLLPELDMSDREKEEQRRILRDLAISCLRLADVRVLKEWEGWPEGSAGLSFDDRMSLYGRSDKQGNITVRRIADDHEVLDLKGDGKPAWHFFAPEGRFFVRIRSDYTVEGWRPPDSHPLFAFRAPGPPAGARVDQLGRTLAYPLRDGTINLYSLPAGTVRRQVKIAAWDEAALEFSPDCNYLAVAAGRYRQPQRRTLRVYDMRSTRPPLELTHPDWIHSIAWYPDSKTVAAAGWEFGEIRIWDVLSGRKLNVISGGKAGAPSLHINRTGDILTSSDGWKWGYRVWHAQTGQELLTNPWLTDDFSHSSQDGRLFARGIEDTKIRLTECAPGQVCRTLVRDHRAEKGKKYYMPTLHPDGRLLAVSMESGVGMWDLPSGRELAFLPIGRTESVAFDSSGTLWTYGHEGLLRWPIQATPADSRTMVVGPPQTVLATPTFGVQMAVSRDGGVAVAALGPTNTGVCALVFHRDKPHRPIRLGPHTDVRDVCVSPDGRYVATVSVAAEGAKVWQADTGQLLHHFFPNEKVEGSGFTPDGKRLHIGAHAFDVGTWQQRTTFEGYAIGWGGCISNDGTLFAGHAGRDGVTLFDWQSGRQLAKLGVPDQGRVFAPLFNRDATQLIGTDMDNLAIQVWDLRKLRAELRELGLDWDAPPYPPATEPELSGRAAPQVRADLGHLEDNVLFGSQPTPQQLQTIIAANSIVLAFNPYNIKAYRQRGRAYCYRAINQSRLGIADFSMALALLPANDLNRVDLLGHRAAGYLHYREYDKAAADIREAERIDSVQGAGIRQRCVTALNRRAHENWRSNPSDALRDLDAAVQMDPRDGMAQNNLAWMLLTGPKELRDATKAVRHARAAVKLSESQEYLNTLGVALYRNGEFSEAVPILEKSLAAGKGEFDAFDQYFLAMCHAKLGNAARAKGYLERAVKWMEGKNLPAQLVEELQSFRVEAEAELRAR
jgi:serine/threonine protein kinase/WD40 repeat protein/tetratricopeptide (TPR) repeat protein